MNVKDGKKKMYVCPVITCQKKFKHRQSLHNVNYSKTCKVCNKRFSRGDSLTRHIKKNRCKSIDKELKCDTCQKVFTKKYNYLRHLSTHVHDKKEAYSCDMCDKKYERKDKFIAHRKSHEDNVDKIKIQWKKTRQTFSAVVADMGEDEIGSSEDDEYRKIDMALALGAEFSCSWNYSSQDEAEELSMLFHPSFSEQVSYIF